MTLLCVALPRVAFAQECTPTAVRLLATGDGMRGIVPNPDTDETTNIIPPGWVHVIFDASVGYTDPAYTPAQPVEVSLIRQIHWGPGSWWSEGVAQSLRRSTPLGAWPLYLVMFPGERLAARFPQMPGQFYVMYTGVYFPQACLSRFLGLTAPVGAGSFTFPTLTITGTLQGTATPVP